jgi:hypothetical protein
MFQEVNGAKRSGCKGKKSRDVTRQTNEIGLLYLYQRRMRNGSPGTTFSAPV